MWTYEKISKHVAISIGVIIPLLEPKSRIWVSRISPHVCPLRIITTFIGAFLNVGTRFTYWRPNACTYLTNISPKSMWEWLINKSCGSFKKTIKYIGYNFEPCMGFYLACRKKNLINVTLKHCHINIQSLEEYDMP